MNEFDLLPLPLNQGVYLFPSVQQLSEILDSFPDEESIENFRGWHNSQIGQMGLLFLVSDYMPMLESLRNLCISVGYEFTQLLLDFLTHTYYSNLFGAGLWMNQKELRQSAFIAIDLLRSGTDHQVKKASFPYGLLPHQTKIHESIKNRFISYKLAGERIENFIQLASIHRGETVNNLLANFLGEAVDLHTAVSR